ncbi:MAG: ATP-binding cassette domain-containing protein [Desulfatiglans sp.]|jgi:ABC-2 type transport system ATP-binding protein|nr:ATP-binding cassette domain-containing protein [Thermodesulfobacteriota bacterium]MEE4352469.1 ATP-binding cassette domain-containing protein [Desulfatiglans sp.]
MIHVENLTKYYGDLCAVDQISFDIPRGQILGLLGPNGAGKTTTLRMLTGFLRPTAGYIRVKDFNIDEHTLEIKRLLGYLPESAPLYHDMLAYDYLAYVADIRGLRGAEKLSRIRRLAELCDLNSVMHQSVGELSKGFKQRVGIAHAMMSDPEILIMDEPTSGLDPNQIVEIRDIIKRIGKQKTIILSTHILSEAEAACDRIVIINRGKIAADDSTKNLKQSAQGEYFITLTLQDADTPSVTERLGSIEGINDIVPIGEDGPSLRFKLSCRSADDLRGEIYRTIKKTDWILLEIHKETKTLESIFGELTKEN